MIRCSFLYLFRLLKQEKSFIFFQEIIRYETIKKQWLCKITVQRVDKPSHSLSVLRSGAHEWQIRSAKVAVLSRLQRFSFTLKRRQRAKINYILALCLLSETSKSSSFLIEIKNFTLWNKPLAIMKQWVYISWRVNDWYIN